MAAGIVYHDITTSAGETFTIGSWVPDTGSPDANVIPVHISYDSAGTEVWTAAKITTMFGYLDGLEGKLDTLHTDLATTLAGYLDGLETLIGATNSALGGTLATSATATGNVAHDAADSGNPIKIGHKATSSLSGATMVSSGDRADGVSGIDGVAIVRLHCNLEDIVSGTASNTDGTSTQVIAAAGSGIKQYLTRVSLSNTHASTSVMVALKSGSTSKYRVNVPPGGREFAFDPPLPPNAANEAWNFDPDSAVTTIECSMVGFKSKV